MAAGLVWAHELQLFAVKDSSPSGEREGEGGGKGDDGGEKEGRVLRLAR